MVTILRDHLEIEELNKFPDELRKHLKDTKPQFQEIISSSKTFTEQAEIERALMLDHPFWSLMTTHNIGLMFVCTFAEYIDYIRFGKRESMRSVKGKESDLVSRSLYASKDSTNKHHNIIETPNTNNNS